MRSQPRISLVGLSENEAHVFAALHSLGEGTASMIAQRAGVKRSIAYFVLNELVKRGFAQELTQQKIKRYAAVPAARFFQSIQANIENLRMMLPLLRGMYQDYGHKSTIELHEGREAILPVYRSMEFGHKSYHLTCWDKLSEHFPEEVQRWSVQAANPKNRTEVKNLIIDDKTGREITSKIKSHKKQTLRFLPKEMCFGMNFGISDNTVAITSFDPLFVIVIHSAQVSMCASLLFELAWQSTRSVKKI